MTTSGTATFNMDAQRAHYVYAHTRAGGVVFYIGKGKKRRAYSTYNRNRYWQAVVRKEGSYGVVILADKLTQTEALEEEALLIAHFKKFGTLTNILDRGDIAPSSHPEVAAKISQSLRGIVRSEATCAKLRAVPRTAEWNAKLSEAAKRKVVSDETRARQSIAQTGRKHTEASKQKIREKALLQPKGIPLSAEHRALISANNPWKGKKRPELSALLKEKGYAAGANNPMYGKGHLQRGADNPSAQPVVGYHDIHGMRRWDTVKEAATCLGVSSTAICQAIKKNGKSKGWRLERA